MTRNRHPSVSSKRLRIGSTCGCEIRRTISTSRLTRPTTAALSLEVRVDDLERYVGVRPLAAPLVAGADDLGGPLHFAVALAVALQAAEPPPAPAPPNPQPAPAPTEPRARPPRTARGRSWA